MNSVDRRIEQAIDDVLTSMGMRVRTRTLIVPKIRKRLQHDGLAPCVRHLDPSPTEITFDDPMSLNPYDPTNPPVRRLHGLEPINHMGD